MYLLRLLLSVSMEQERVKEMATNVTQVMVDEHKLILRMIDLIEKNTKLLKQGKFNNWQFYLDAVDFIRNYADRFHHAKEDDVLFVESVKNGIPEKQSPIETMHMEHDQDREIIGTIERATENTAEIPGLAKRYNKLDEHYEQQIAVQLLMTLQIPWPSNKVIGCKGSIAVLNIRLQ